MVWEAARLFSKKVNQEGQSRPISEGILQDALGLVNFLGASSAMKLEAILLIRGVSSSQKAYSSCWPCQRVGL